MTHAAAHLAEDRQLFPAHQLFLRLVKLPGSLLDQLFKLVLVNRKFLVHLLTFSERQWRFSFTVRASVVARVRCSLVAS